MLNDFRSQEDIMKKILTIAGAMFALLMIGSTPAMAQHCGGHGGQDSGPAVFGGGVEGGGCGGGCMGGGHGGKHGENHGKGGKMGHAFWKSPEVAKQLALTDVQIKKIEAIHENVMKTGEAVRKEMKDLKGTMKEAFKATPVDAAKVKAIAEKISVKKNAIFLMHVQMKAETMNVLTAAQKTKLFEMKPGMGGDCKCGKGGDCKCGADCKCDKAGGDCKCAKGGDCKCGADCKCDKAGGDCKCDKAAGGCKCGEAGGCPMMDDDDDDDE